MRIKRTELLAAVICVAMGVPGAGNAAETAHVHVLDTAPIPIFDPADVVILFGDTVEWDNHADRIHTVTHVTCKRADARYDDCEFDSIFSMTPGTTFAHTFSENSGTFDYKCTIHGFTGRITVLSDPGALPNLSVPQLTAYDTPLRTSKRLEAVVGNSGDAASLETKILFQYRAVDGSWIDIGEPTVPRVNPGGSVIINQDWPTFDKLGDFPVRVIVDASRTQVESDESDNQREIVVPVLIPAGILPGVGPPDLS